MANGIDIKPITEMFPIDKEAARSKQGLKLLEKLLSKGGRSSEKEMKMYSYLSKDKAVREHGKDAAKGANWMNNPKKVIDKSKMKLDKSTHEKYQSLTAQKGLDKYVGSTKAGHAFKNTRDPALAKLAPSSAKIKANRSKMFAKVNKSPNTTPPSPVAPGKTVPINNVSAKNFMEKRASAQNKTAKKKSLKKVAQEVDQDAIDKINRVSTVKGNAKDKGVKAALSGAVAGGIYGASKGGNNTERVLKALWHGTAGAAAGAGIGYAAGGAVRAALPLTDEDKVRMYEDHASPIR